MRMNRAYWIASLFLVFSLTLSAQHKYTLEADLAFEAQQYAHAIELYKKAATKEKDRKIKEEMTFKMAECYRMMGEWARAESYYSRAIKRRYEDPIAILYMADCIKAQGRYEDAMIEYDNYRQKAPTDSRGTRGVQSCKDAIEMIQNPTRYELVNMREFNSKFNDFAPAWGDKEQTTILFTSSRDESTGKDFDGWTGQNFADLYMSQQERKKGKTTRGKATDAEPAWSVPVPLDEMINTGADEGVATIDERGNILYFTRCNREKRSDVRCRIYMSRKKGKSWGEAEELPFDLDSLASIGQPTLIDENTMIFAADMEGGFGGRDLWVSTYDKRGRKWGKPVNLGPKVNTEGDERYPVMHKDGYLYFTSDGHPGLGGWDLFKSKRNDDGSFGEAENLGAPINSHADDFALIFKGDDDKYGYMSSNRPGGRGGDDIYKVFLKPLLYTLKGVVKDAKSGRPLDLVTVKLVGSDGTAIEGKTDKEGYYFFDVANFKEETNYTLNFERKDYLTKSGSVTTVGIPMSAYEKTTDGYLYGMVHNKELDPIKRPIVLPHIEYDFNKWDLRPEAMESLDKLVEILEDNPNIVIELRSHTDHIGSDEANQRLSQKRADTCVSYLISKGIEAERLVAKGMGESEPYVIPENWDGPSYLKPNDRLTEAFINRLKREQGNEADEFSRQLNRRTDFKVLRDNYVPKQQEKK